MCGFGKVGHMNIYERPCSENEIEDKLIAYDAALENDGRLTPVVDEAIHNALNIVADYDRVFYIAGPLTGMPEAIKDRYGKISEMIGKITAVKMFGYAPHLHGTDPVAHPDVTPAEVRDIDYMMAAIVPDYHINCLDPVSHGNAIEEGWAEEAGIPVLYLAPRDMRLSRLVLGMRNVIDVVRYGDFDADGLPQVQEFLDGIAQQAAIS
jgi:hypothetical protein